MSTIRHPNGSRPAPSPPPTPAMRRPQPAPAISVRPWKPRPIGQTTPRVLVLADVPNWAWARKAAALKKCLAGRIDVTVIYSTDLNANAIIRAANHDLYHTFEVCQVGAIPVGWPMTTGITAHVIKNWEERQPGCVRVWADRALGFHANSRMLQRELEAFLRRPVFYVPNGVDDQFFRRTRRRSSNKLVVGYVARPNVRKGHDVVAEACRLAGVELRDLVRKWKDKNVLTADQMRDYYQDIHVLAVSSDMDGTPNPALEAAACECAVVSNPIGNMPEFIQSGVNGYLTERTVEGLTAALRSLAARPIDEVEAMGRAARASILSGWTWQRQAPAYATMWEQCLGLRAQAVR